MLPSRLAVQGRILTPYGLHPLLELSSRIVAHVSPPFLACSLMLRSPRGSPETALNRCRNSPDRTLHSFSFVIHRSFVVIHCVSSSCCSSVVGAFRAPMADRDSRDALAASCELPSGTPDYTTDRLGYGLRSSSSEYPPHHTHHARRHPGPGSSNGHAMRCQRRDLSSTAPCHDVFVVPST